MPKREGCMPREGACLEERGACLEGEGGLPGHGIVGSQTPMPPQVWIDRH